MSNQMQEGGSFVRPLHALLLPFTREGRAAIIGHMICIRRTRHSQENGIPVQVRGVAAGAAGTVGNQVVHLGRQSKFRLLGQLANVQAVKMFWSCHV